MRKIAKDGFVAESGKVERLRETLVALWQQDLRRVVPADQAAVSPAEYREGMRASAVQDRIGFTDRLDAMVAAWMTITDTSGDGLVDIDEYTTMFHKTMGATTEALAEAFRHLDRDSDGTLSREEVREATEEYFTSDDPLARGNWLFGLL